MVSNASRAKMPACRHALKISAVFMIVRVSVLLGDDRLVVREVLVDQLRDQVDVGHVEQHLAVRRRDADGHWLFLIAHHARDLGHGLGRDEP